MCKVRGERIGIEYYIANYKFMEPPEDEIDGEITDEKKQQETYKEKNSSTEVIGENVSKVKETELTACIEGKQCSLSYFQKKKD